MRSYTVHSNPDLSSDQPSELIEQPYSYTDLAEKVQSLSQETSRLNQDISRLKGRSNGLIGIMVGILFLSGSGLGWFMLQMQNLDQRISSAVAEQIERLEQQVADLNRQIPADFLATQERVEALIENLEVQIEQLKSQLPQISIPTQIFEETEGDFSPDESDQSTPPPESTAPVDVSP